MKSKVVGVDIGGSHITAAVVDLDRKQIAKGSVSRKLIDSNGTREHIISSWCTSVKECLRQIEGADVYIGIAMPGPFDYEEGISYIQEQAKYRSLYQVNIKEALAEELGIPATQIQFHNDASSFLKGEVFAGIAQNFKNVLGFTLGTGFGSSIYRDGEAIDANLWCSPFREGIAEDYFSTRWFVRRFAEKTSRQVKNVKELAALYQEVDMVKEIFDEFGKNLADFFLNISKQEQTDLIVLGGNISKSFQYFHPSLKKRLMEQGVNVSVESSLLNENASLLGAASCWLQSK